MYVCFMVTGLRILNAKLDEYLQFQLSPSLD